MRRRKNENYTHTHTHTSWFRFNIIFNRPTIYPSRKNEQRMPFQFSPPLTYTLTPEPGGNDFKIQINLSRMCVCPAPRIKYKNPALRELPSKTENTYSRSRGDIKISFFLRPPSGGLTGTKKKSSSSPYNPKRFQTGLRVVLVLGYLVEINAIN